MRTDPSRGLTLLAGAALVLALAGCSGIRDQLGLSKTSPDEFSVVSKAPLAVPPDFSLRPPRPGAPRPQETQPAMAARSALLQGAGGAVFAAPGGGRDTLTDGEQALLGAAGTEMANPEIREIVNRETSILAQRERSFTDSLIFWQEPQPPGQVVDAREEARRLRENAAIGADATEGETAVIQRRRRGWLEGIF